ncbi:MAG: ATP-dependent DNA helicase RecG, partial [Campylobacterales bacterium]|nr:ATP-dependent DNA helicase RecG [Campylobacterales bacterium]
MIKSEGDTVEAERLNKLGVETLLDLALLLPHSYDNTYLSSAPLLEQNNTLHVKILSIKQSPKVLQMLLFCEAWNIQFDGVIFAPKSYQKALFKQGIELHINGKVSFKNGRLQMLQPRSVTQINQLIPKYKTPLQNKTVLELMKRHLSLESLLNEGLHVKEAKSLLSLHFPIPKEVSVFEKEGYSPDIQKCLKFTEIYNYLKKLSRKKVTFPSCAKLEGNEAPFIASLPFSLTKDQQKVIGEIKRDFLSENATKRVVMGDVGCGKTMVILSSVMMAYPKKAVLMAPTTVLARQLFEEASKFLPLHVKTILVTQETDVKEDLEAFDFIIGTHALLYKELPQCALVMVDEQHRFGTKQRSLLATLVSKKAWHPHYIQFSATPIPRTLSMIQSSLVDFSFIKMLPFPKDITTTVIAKQDFKALIAHIKDEIAKKHQCIIVYPLVEESEVINYQSIEEGRGFWEKHFEGVYVTYGKDKNKEAILDTFKEKGNLLISTTVVEVGISLPRLSTIVIVGAERLGLASLHQLRGRVSRNGLKGYCYLYTNLAKSERLEKFSQTLDGFEIAELDLEYRQGG